MQKVEPIYLQIKKHLESLIQQNKNVPNYKLPSENQIAARFHSSRIPVKRALDELVAEGAIYRQQGKGSFIRRGSSAQNPTEQRSVHLLIPHIGYRLIDDMISGIQSVLDEKGIQLYISMTDDSSEKEEELLQASLNRHCDGLIVFPVIRHTYNDMLLQLVLRQFPIVLIGRSLPGLNISSVSCDHYKQAYHVTQYLIDKGHREIGFLTEPGSASPSYAERLLGYRTCILENFTHSFVMQEEVDFFGMNGEEETTEAIERLLGKHPTAIITTNNAADRLYQTLEQYKLDITVATFDVYYNLGMHSRLPIIVHQNPKTIGVLAAEQVCKQIEVQAPPRQIYVDEDILDPAEQTAYMQLVTIVPPHN